MIGLASVCVGVAVAVTAGLLTGNLPSGALRSSRPRRDSSRMQLWLQQAGVRATPRQYLAVAIGGGTAAALFVGAATGIWIIGLVVGAMAALVPGAFFGRRRLQRLRGLQRAWPDGLRDLRASIASGRSLHQAIIAMSHTGPEPIQDAFARYESLASMLDVGPALEVVKAEVADPTTDRVIEVLILAEERGGRILGDIIEDLAEATTRDIRAQEEIETDSLQHKLNAWAVFVIPWLVLVALIIRPGEFRAFYQTPAGFAVIIVGALLSAVGIYIVRRLAKQPVEERVLVGETSTIVSRGGTR